MPTISRLRGRFFCVLIPLILAMVLPPVTAVGEGVAKMGLPSAAAIGRAVSKSTMALLPAAAVGEGGGRNLSPAPSLCQISDTVYRADGSPAQGTAVISWPAFTTAAGQAVASGTLTVTLDSGGGFNARLAPNTGASPAGTYYRAIFKLDDGTTDSEYWVVPNAATTTIGAIRSKLVPSSQAAQFLTRDFADSNYVSLA